jgi:divalent metal cation (Fe/Co/Zn/Cd) transporter
MAANSSRQAAVTLGIRLEVATVIWMAAEAALALIAGLMARSVLLAAFGFDSVIELLSGLVLLWRLSAEHSIRPSLTPLTTPLTRSGGTDIERVERTELLTARISAALLILLCTFVVVSSMFGLVGGFKPDGSALGVAVAVVALVAMPLLAIGKTRANRLIGSASLRADIAETITCAYLAGVTLVGLALSMVLGLWWVQYLAALALLIWLIPETREAFEAARANNR